MFAKVHVAGRAFEYEVRVFLDSFIIILSTFRACLSSGSTYESEIYSDLLFSFLVRRPLFFS